MNKLGAGQQRRMQRRVHIVAGVLVLGYVYAPVPSGAQGIVRLLVLPLLVATGVAMWQAPRLRRLRKAASSRMARTPVGPAGTSAPDVDCRPAGPSARSHEGSAAGAAP